MFGKRVDHKMVQVNAAHRSIGTTADFSVDFLSRDLDNVVRVTMIKATLPRLFPNIYSANNTIVIYHAGGYNTFLIPPGQYTAESLATALTAVCSGIFTSFTYDAASSRYTATYASVTTVTLVAALSTIGPYIGLTSDIVLGSPTAFPDPPQLSGPDEVYIQSQIVAQNSCVTCDPDSTSLNLLGTISFTDTPYGFTGRFDANHLDIAHIELPSLCLRKINVRITDPLGNLLPLPSNCYLDMILQFSFY